MRSSSVLVLSFHICRLGPRMVPLSRDDAGTALGSTLGPGGLSVLSSWQWPQTHGHSRHNSTKGCVRATTSVLLMVRTRRRMHFYKREPCGERWRHGERRREPSHTHEGAQLTFMMLVRAGKLCLCPTAIIVASRTVMNACAFGDCDSYNKAHFIPTVQSE